MSPRLTTQILQVGRTEIGRQLIGNQTKRVTQV
jgi:hypothetical protein